MKKDEIIEVPVVVEESTLPARTDIVSYAIANNATPEVIEKMMELSERHEKNEARKAYHMAMSQFKANPPKIDKDAHVNYSTSKGTVDYKHATLANITNKINSELSKYGLSAAWETKQGEKGISVTCKITHVLGHSESTTLEAAPDASGGKNSIQAIGSTVTYLQRYTLLSAAGLATAEMDDDGVGSEAEYLSKEQLEIVNKVIEEKKIDLSMLLSYMKVESLDKVLSDDYKKLMNAVDKAHGETK